MAFSCKSAGLVVMLTLAALVVSAQATDGQSVWVQNNLKTKIKCNGQEVNPGALIKVKLDVKLKLQLLLEVLDLNGKWVQGSCNVPADVLKLVVQLNLEAKVEVKVAALLGGLIHKVLGTVLGLIILVVDVVIAV